MPRHSLFTLASTACLTFAAALAIPSHAVEAADMRLEAAGGMPPAVTAPTGSRKRAPASNGVYIVRMAGEPAAGYRGQLRGYAATKPAAGQKLDARSADVQNYRSLLKSQHDSVVASVGGRKLYSYGNVFNGFAAQLTEQQAQKLAAMPGVLSVAKDELRTADTSSTPRFLGLTYQHGLWSSAGGATKAGKGMVIGVVDSGIWPENPSFAGTGAGPVPGWLGSCVDGEDFVGADACNGKIVGAQYFNAGWGGDPGIDAQRPWEFNSPRDYDGHGTHTAATAGGNYRTAVTGPAAVYGRVSGMAPGARIAAYKALWSTEDASTANGYNSDLVAAIDQAVADGVDVINYSVSGTNSNFRDPVEIAFMYAADAGVFVAVSAGNSGPTAGTVAHPSPWVTTVAATTHDRSAIGTARLGNGTTYTGAGVAATAVTAPIVNSSAVGLPGADPTAVALCFSTATGGVPALDPAKVAGKIVVCDRGSNARVDKSAAVLEAGGVGMVLVNVTPNSLNADFHSVPTVHLPDTNAAAVHAYAANPGATATVDKATISYGTPAPYVAAFSSRGPLVAGGGDLLKPDLGAPGQDILAAFAPVVGGLDFNVLSGTSMAAPHIAGIAAALKALHPTWSPMAVKSAMMTTARDVLDGDDGNPAVFFAQGAGQVAPNSANNPGVVFDSNYNDWLGFLCGTQLPTTFCTSAGVPVLDPSNFNSPSIAIGDLAGTQTVTRTLKNVSGKTSNYSVKVDGLRGITVRISPAKFTLAPGASKTVSISFRRTKAPLNAYVAGTIAWSDDCQHRARIPVVIRPVPLGAPAQVSGSYSVKFGYDGPFSVAPRGLVPALTASGSVAVGDSEVYSINFPAGMTYGRFSLFDANVTPGADLDLRLFDAAFNLVGASGGPTSAEEINVLNPSGVYYIVIDGYAVPPPDSSASFTLFAWGLGTAAAGNMTVSAPASANTGSTGTVTIGTSGLVAGTKYLGSVVYSGTAGMPNPTIVRVDP
jgi:subtilisin family serine protease